MSGMSSAQGSVVGGGIALVIGVVVTVAIAQVAATPWTVTQVLIAVGAASFFAGFFGSYYADEARGA